MYLIVHNDAIETVIWFENGTRWKLNFSNLSSFRKYLHRTVKAPCSYLQCLFQATNSGFFLPIKTTLVW